MFGLFNLLRAHPKAAVAALTLSTAGVAGLLRDEGSVNQVYLDVGKIPTVCAGHTRTVSLADVGKFVPDAVCEGLLRQDVSIAESGVKSAVRVRLTQDQYDSLVSLTFNIGNGAFRSSTLARKLNAGDCRGAAREFDRWVLVKGKRVRGLVNRRAGERSRFEAGCV